MPADRNRGTVATQSEQSSPLEQPARPPTTQDVVLNALRQAIVTGHLRPGERLLQDAVADQIGVSRVPVREALNALRAAGQVRYSPHRGYWVSALSTEEVREIDVIRGLLEGEAIRRAVAAMDDGVVAELATINDRLRKASDADDTVEFIRLNHEFHFAIFEKAGMSRLSQHLEMLWRSADGYRHAVFRDIGTRRDMIDEHDTMIDACRRKDVEPAVAAMDEHRRRATETLLSSMAAEADGNENGPA